MAKRRFTSALGAAVLGFIFSSAAADAKGLSEPEFGVLRVWSAKNGETAHVAGPGDIIVVEVKNFSGWVIRQVEVRGYFADKAIDSASDDLKRVVRNHAFEVANAAADALENASEGDIATLKLVLSKNDFDRYSRGLLTAEGKWSDAEEQSVREHKLRGRRAQERVIPALLQTNLLETLRDLLPLDPQKQVDVPKTLKLLEDIRQCSQDLIRSARDKLHPKINDLIFDNVAPLNAYNASVDQFRRPKASPLSDYEWFRFRLVEDSKSADAWNELRRSGLYQHDVNFTLVTTVGDRSEALPTNIERNFDATTAPPADADRFLLQIASLASTTGAIFVFGLIFLVLCRLCVRTDLVADTSGVRRPDGLRPHSLARAQMAFWFLVIVGASLFLWIATGAWHILNDTCLWLIGIGSGTALGSALIASKDGGAADAGDDCPLPRDRSESFKEFKQRLSKEIQTAGTAPQGETPEAATARLQRRDALLKQQERVNAMPDSWFRRLLRDWLTDGDTYSFHRYQMLAWTLVLGLFFVVKVWSLWELPTFDATTLALLGITSGTYLGFKLQKNQ